MEQHDRDWQIVQEWADLIRDRMDNGTIVNYREQALVALVDYLEERGIK